jgi:hypothetical protein
MKLLNACKTGQIEIVKQMLDLGQTTEEEDGIAMLAACKYNVFGIYLYNCGVWVLVVMIISMHICIKWNSITKTTE